MGLKQTRQTLNHLTQIAPDSLGAPHLPTEDIKTQLPDAERCVTQINHTVAKNLTCSVAADSILNQDKHIIHYAHTAADADSPSLCYANLCSSLPKSGVFLN